LRLDGARFAEILMRGAAWLLEWREAHGDFNGPSYVAPYGRFVVCRFLSAVLPLCTPELASRIRQALAAEQESARTGQAFDGGWGTPQATALNLTALLELGERGPAVDAAAMYLCERQQTLGCWRSEPLWLMPGPAIYPAEFYESVPVTTAVCLRALAAWRRTSRTRPILNDSYRTPS
jgi:hypothetical protein